MDPLQDPFNQALEFDYRLLLGAVVWSVFWAAVCWATYRLIINRVLRLLYARIRLAPEEHALRLGIPALLLSLVTGVIVGISFMPFSPLAVRRGVEIALWVLLTVFAIRMLESIVIDAYLVEHRGMRLPRLLRDIVKALVYLTVFATLFQHLYGLNIGPLLTTSAVFTMVIGLAAQDTLGNLFAGLATSIDQPYQLDSWITIDGKERGRVVAITWRSTTIDNWKGEKIIFPNNVLSKVKIKVHPWPLGYHKEEFLLTFSTLVPTDRVRRILFETLDDVPYVEQIRPPALEFVDFNDGFMTYLLGVWIKDGTYPPVRTDVPIRLWYHLARENLALGANSWGGTPKPPRPESVYVDTAAEIQSVRELLAQVDFLTPLPEPELDQIAMRCEIHPYATNEILFRQGAEGSTFYVIKRGRVGVMVRDEAAGELVQVATLEEGAIFGEMSLLTGERRSATIQALTETEVLAITRENFQHLLHANPAIIDAVSQVIAKRSRQTRHELAAHHADRPDAQADEGDPKAKEAHFTLRNSIRSFFKLT